jgi:hypothetical protein
VELGRRYKELQVAQFKYGQQYRDAGERYYEQKYRDHLLRRLQKQAATFGFQLTPNQAIVVPVS